MIVDAHDQGPLDNIQAQQSVCLGRDVEIRHMKEHLLANRRVVLGITGGAGIGKTAICLSVLSSGDVVRKFGNRRFYTALEGVGSAAQMIMEISKTLEVKDPSARTGSFAEPSSAALVDRVLTSLGDTPAVFFLDGLESPHDSDPEATEKALSMLEQKQGLSLIIAIRGDVYPQGLHWDDLIFLTPLSFDAGLTLFSDILMNGGHGSPGRLPERAVRSIVSKFNNIPIAISLMALAVRRNTPLSRLETLWDTQRFRLYSGRRISDLFLSTMSTEIAVWVVLALMENVWLRRCVGYLALAPNGIAVSDLPTLLQTNAVALHQSHIIGELCDRGLASVQVDNEAGRIRLKPAIRAVVARSINALVPHDKLNYFYDYFFTLAGRGEDIGRGRTSIGIDTAKDITRLKSEILNLEAVISHALKSTIDANIPLRAIRAALALGRFERFAGGGTINLLKSAEKVATSIHGTDGKRLHADSLRVMGSFARMRSDPDRMSTWYYKHAEAIYKEIKDDIGQAHCVRSYGDILRTKGEYKGASHQYLTAKSRYEAILSCANTYEDCEMTRDAKRGLANCIERLGDIAHMARFDSEERSLTDADYCYNQALGIYNDIDDLIGRANCYKGLGDVRMARADSEKAHEYYKEAKTGYEQGCYEIGVANCEYSIGDICFKNGRYGDAIKHYESTGRRYKQIFSYHGQGNCLYSLGDVILANGGQVASRDECLERAKNMYDGALKMYDIAGSGVGRTNCWRGLGDICAIRGSRGDAELYYKEADKWRSQAFQDDRGPAISFIAFDHTCYRWRR